MKVYVLIEQTSLGDMFLGVFPTMEKAKKEKANMENFAKKLHQNKIKFLIYEEKLE